MAVHTPAAPSAQSARTQRVRRHRWWSLLWSAARTPRGMIGLVLFSLVVLIAIIGPFVAPYSPNADQLTMDFAKPSAQFLLGTDVETRDVLSRVLNGGWVMLIMAAGATVFGVAVGTAAGVSAAYLRGPSDGIIMRAVDVFLSFPQLVFALLLLSLLGPRLWLITLAVGFSHAPQVARVLRSATLDVAERDFVRTAELQGMGPARIMRKEILPNLVSPLMVEAGLRLTYSIVIMAGLAFLGFGQPPPTANWGTMINENQEGLPLNPWAVIVPALLIALLTIGTNMFTDAFARTAIGVDRRPEEVALIDNLAQKVAQ
jgi:peptide/nickel transport system permease protein